MAEEPPPDPRERADEIARQARGDSPGTPSESDPPVRDKGVLIFFGVVILIGGIALLMWSSAHAPTVENTLAGESVLTRDYYYFYRFAAWTAIVVGALMSLAAILRKRGR